MPPAWLISLIGIAVLLGWKLYQGERHRVGECLKRQALKRNGAVTSIFLALPQLSFRYKGTSLVVSAMPGSGGEIPRPSQTFAYFYLPSFPHDNLRIRSRSLQALIDKLFWGELRIGNTAFDAQFVVQGNDEQFVRHLLGSHLQNQLFELGQRGGVDVSLQKVRMPQTGESDHGKASPSPVSIEKTVVVEEPRCKITLGKICTEDSDYDALIETALMFYDGLKSQWQSEAHG